MRRFITHLLFTGSVLFASPAFATGLATCDSGPEENWKPKEELQQMLEEKGWQVRRVKVDGGCYEVYAMDETGSRVEAYFDPLTFDPIPLDDDDPEEEHEEEHEE